MTRAVGQLGDPRVRKVVWLTLGLTGGAAVVLWIGIWWLLESTALFSLAWLDATVDVLGGLAVMVLTVVFFPALVSAFVGLFLEDVAAAVEARHYPDLPAAREQPLGEALFTGLRFLGVTVVANLAALVFLLVPPLFPFVFYGVNGYLLSREYYELVAFRRLDQRTARGLRQAHQGGLLLVGVLITVLLTVPVVNLVTPMVATALMVHRFERIRRRHGAPATVGA